MNDSPVVSEPIPRAARARSRALLRLRAHGAETAAVAIGAAAVAVQAARLGPWSTDDAVVALATATGTATGTGDATGPGDAPGSQTVLWYGLLALLPRAGLSAAGSRYATALALLFFVVALSAATGTLRVLRGRRAWPHALATAAAVAVCPPALGWLFDGTGRAAGLCCVALLVRTLAGAAARGHLARPRTAAPTALLAALGALALPAGLALAASYPAALLCAGRRRGAAAPALRACLPYTATYAPVVWWLAAGPVAGGAPLPGFTLDGLTLPGPVLPAAALLGAVLLGGGATAGAGAPPPVRLGALALGTMLLLPGPGLPPSLALVLCGAVLLAARSRHARTVGGAALGAGACVVWAGAGWAGAGWAVLLAAAAVGAAPAVPRPCLAPGRAPGAPLAAPFAAGAATRTATARTAVAGAAVTATLLAGMSQGVRTAVPHGDDALCFTRARYGQMFAGYADRLGLRRSTVALASPGGVLLLGEQRAVDLRGRTDPRLAAARDAHDYAALRRHLFVRVRPEFVQVTSAEATRTGLTARRLAAHGYRPLLRQGAGGDFVHRSAVTAPERLPGLRRWARKTLAGLSTGFPNDPSGSPVRRVSGDREPDGKVGHSAAFRPDERTCHR